MKMDKHMPINWKSSAASMPSEPGNILIHYKGYAYVATFDGFNVLCPILELDWSVKGGNEHDVFSHWAALNPADEGWISTAVKVPAVNSDIVVLFENALHIASVRGSEIECEALELMWLTEEDPLHEMFSRWTPITVPQKS